VAAAPLSAAAGVIIWRWFPPQAGAAAGHPQAGAALPWRAWPWPALIIAFGWMGVFGMYDTSWTVFLDHLGASPAMIGVSWTLFSLPLLLFSVVGGRLADAVGARRRLVVMGGLILNTLLVFAYSRVAAYGWAVAISVVESLAIGLVSPSFQSLVMDGAPEHMRGAVQGLVQGSATLGQLLLALASGYLLARSVRLPFELGAVVMVSSVCAAAWFPSNTRTEVA
jgi:DHA1 family multidrug resistance protein-like MFS transporter